MFALYKASILAVVSAAFVNSLSLAEHHNSIVMTLAIWLIIPFVALAACQ